jgi:hypothetical protein
MSTHRRRRIDRDTAELLLSEAAAGRRTGRDPLVDVLIAASTRATDDLPGGTIAGEQAAVDAFRAARLSGVATPTKKSAIKVAVASLLTWKALAAAGITASAIGGAAFMGGVENPIPTPSESRPLTHGPASASGDRGLTTSAKGPQESVAAPNGSAAGTPQASAQSAAPSPGPSGRTSAGRSSSAAQSSYVGLCRAYEAQSGSNHERLQNPAFARLIRAAGEKEKVDAFCASLLGAHPSSRENPNGSSTTPSSGVEPPTVDSQNDSGAPQPELGGKPDTPAGG